MKDKPISQSAKLVDTLLGEADFPPGSPGRMRRGTSTNQAGEKIAGDFERDAPDEPEDDEEEDLEDDDEEINSEEDFETKLMEIIEDAIPSARVSTFGDVMMLTRNRGLVVKMPTGKFQITIVQA
jgi:hypothetical protein